MDLTTWQVFLTMIAMVGMGAFLVWVAPIPSKLPNEKNSTMKQVCVDYNMAVHSDGCIDDEGTVHIIKRIWSVEPYNQ